MRSYANTLGLVSAVIMTLVGLLACGNAQPQAETTASTPSEEFPVLTEDVLEGRIHAPDFPEGLQWLNAENPISISHLNGKVVLVDFWTYCSINCMHVIPELKKLEEKYADELIVIGVHSAKFTSEKDSEAIRQAVLRYQITHPVVNDDSFQIWQAYGAKAWPTFAIINPAGRVVGMHSGENVFPLFDNVIGQIVKHFDAKSELSRRKMSFGSEAMKQEQTLLKYPGRIAADATAARLYISDSNHNRILVTALDGKVEFIIGSGMTGNRDGSFTEARFNRPQGVCLDGDVLYIADTENHTIRAANLKSKKVTTVLGTGVQASEYNVAGAGTNVALNSPWDLLVHDGKLYIAMAGSHQLWITDVGSWQARPFAGSSREARVDSTLLEAALAQPSGVTSDGRKLYFVDSETSSIRSADFASSGSVSTIVGSDLFDFGDTDGDASAARLQHPLGVLHQDGKLYVADTYNHKIKIVDPVQRTAKTFAGTGRPGFKDGDLSTAEFNEPSGLTLIGSKLYVADCNNHQIRLIDLGTGMVSTLMFRDLAPVAARTIDNFSGREIKLQPNRIKSGAAMISIALVLPDGYKFNELAPFYVNFKSSEESAVEIVARPEQIVLDRSTGEFKIPVTTGAGESEVTLETVVYLCKADSPACLFDMVRVKIPVTVDPKGPGMFGVAIPVRTLPRL